MQKSSKDHIFNCLNCGNTFYRKYVYNYQIPKFCCARCRAIYFNKHKSKTLKSIYLRYALLLYQVLLPEEKYFYISFVCKMLGISREYFYQKLRELEDKKNKIVRCHNGHTWSPQNTPVCPICHNDPIS